MIYTMMFIASCLLNAWLASISRFAIARNTAWFASGAAAAFATATLMF